ncbi:MAG: phage antirepressor KilAC domain-containing protein [Oscillospiraceae bacterium]|nr:phage antirepressor KilAC domain-containing protein [Oscillospiraceae bacterium]
MQKTLKIICQQEVLGKNFTVYGDFENPLFLAKDVAEWIDYSKTSRGAYNISAMLKTIDEDEKLVLKILISGQNRSTWFLTEDGLYEVLMQSRKPIAKAFKSEVKKILKSIRKHGAYVNSNLLDELISNPEAYMKLLSALKSEREALKKERGKREALEDFVEKLAPKARYCDVVLNCKNAIAISVIANDYGVSAVAFNRLLKDLGIQRKVNGTWILYKEYANQGFTVSRTLYDNAGNVFKIHTYWTQSGRMMIYDILRHLGILPEVERLMM